MTFEEYIKIVAPKIGPNSAFDLSRDARIKALEDIIIEKGLATRQELEAEMEKQLGDVAQNIAKMPPFPEQPKPDTNANK